MRSRRRIIPGIATLGWVPTLFLVGLLWARESRATPQERTAIKVTRIYTGSDNQTHAEE